MNTTENDPNADIRTNETALPDELATLRDDLETLSGNELEAWLQKWRILLLTDAGNPSLMLTIFSEMRHKVTMNTPIKDCLSYLDFLAQLKQALFSYDIFSYGEEVYSEYMEGLYRLSGSCSYYFKPDLIQKYVPEESERYEQARRLLEPHYQNDMFQWLENDLGERVGYHPSSEEIHYLTERAWNIIMEEGNMDGALFYLYRAILLSLKRGRASDAAEALAENEKLLNCLSRLATTYQLASDDAHALEILEYAKKLSDEELTAQNITPQKPDGVEPGVWGDSIRAHIPESYCELRRLILRKKGHIQSDLSHKENGPAPGDVLSSYQEALTFSEAVYGSESSQAEEIRGDIALYRARSGELSEVNVLLSQLSAAEQAEDWDSAESLLGLISEIYEDAGNFEQAILHYQKKVQIIVDMYGDDSDMAADYYASLGELYEKAGKISEARDCHEHALTNYRAYLLRTQEEDADDPENTLSNYEECLYNMGRMHLNAGEYEEAISHFEEAVDIFNSRSDYSDIKYADYQRALAQTYEKMSFMGKAVHCYLWAWDTYHTVAEFNKLRERNATLFESETKECEAGEEQVRLHLLELGYGGLFRPFEEIDYPSLTKEEQTYFLDRFAQLIRRRIDKEDLWKKWTFLWNIYYWLCLNWQQRTGAETPDAIKDAFYILQNYLRKECGEEELADFSEKFFGYVNWLSQSGEEDSEDEDCDNDEDDENDEEHAYLPFYYSLADLFESISQSDVDFYPLQRMICGHLPVYAEVFTSAYYKEEEDYTDYEKQLRYRQVISSPAFAEWIAVIQRNIMNL